MHGVEQKKRFFFWAMEKHHHFSPFKVDKFNATEIFCFSSPIPMQRVWLKSNRNFSWIQERNSHRFRWSEGVMFVRENNRMIQLIFFYCIRHEMTHKYQLFSALSLPLHCVFCVRRPPIRAFEYIWAAFVYRLWLGMMMWNWSIHFRMIIIFRGGKNLNKKQTRIVSFNSNPMMRRSTDEA